MWNRTNVFLAVCLAVTLALAFFGHTDTSKRNYEFLPEMKYSPAWSSFEPNRNFNSGLTIQSQPAGTIARGQANWHYDSTPEDARRAGEEVLNPYRVRIREAEEFPTQTSEDPPPLALQPSDGTDDVQQPQAGANELRESGEKRLADAQRALQDSVMRGAQEFRIYCACCHGQGGAGDGPVAQRGFPPPPSLLTGKSLEMKDGQLFHILTSGQGSMSSFAAQLSPARRWDAINFVRNLQRSAAGNTVPEQKPLGQK